VLRVGQGLEHRNSPELPQSPLKLTGSCCNKADV
jgi:hypothetical protein